MGAVASSCQEVRRGRELWWVGGWVGVFLWLLNELLDCVIGWVGGWVGGRDLPGLHAFEES